MKISQIFKFKFLLKNIIIKVKKKIIILNKNIIIVNKERIIIVNNEVSQIHNHSQVFIYKMLNLK
jgi:hypothetical protein